MTKHTPITPASAAPAAALPAAEPHPTPAPAAAPSLPALPDEAIVPVAERHDGWTPARQREFLEILADTGNVTRAAVAVGMTAQSAWRLRRRTDARAFDAAWEAALERSLQQLLPAAIDRALNGTVRERWYAGEIVATERVYHDHLLKYLLERGERMLGAARARRALREEWDKNMDALEAGETAPAEPSPPPAPYLREPEFEWDIYEDEWVTDAPLPEGADEEEFALDPDEAFPEMAGWRYASAEEAETFSRWCTRHHGDHEEARRRFFAATRPPCPPGGLGRFGELASDLCR
jgi:hypothetical protein